MNLQKLDHHLDEAGRPVADETLNEIRRVLYRIRDFEQVYNICEGQFKKTEVNFQIKETLDHVRTLTESDLKKRSITVTNTYDLDLPEKMRCSQSLFRQVVLNLLHASVRGNFRTNVDIKASSKSTEAGPNVIVEIINSRTDLSKQECNEIEDLCLEEELSRILEVDSIDTNLKIALILARQLGWPIDFVVDGKESRFVLVVPSTPWNSSGDAAAIEAPREPLANQQSPRVFAAPANESDDQPNIVQQNDDLRQDAPKAPGPQCHADCLLVSCSDLVPLFEKALGFKCDESFLEESAINSVTRSFKDKKCGCAPYKFIFVDLDDPTLLLGRFMVSLNKILAANPNSKIEVFACASTSSERMLKKCREVKVTFISKPLTKDKVSHLVEALRD